MAAVPEVLNDQPLALVVKEWSVTLQEKANAFFEQIPELESLSAQAAALVAQVNELKIADAESYQNGVELARALKVVITDAKEIIHPYTELMHKGHKALCGIEAKYTGEASTSFDGVKKSLGTYDMQQERIRQAEERRLQDELRRQQESDAQAEAERLAANGQHEEAEQVIEQAIAAPPPVVIAPSIVPQVQGKSSRKTFKYRLKDASKLKAEFLIPDEQRIGQIVRSMGEKAHTLVGEGAIEIYEDRTVAVRV